MSEYIGKTDIPNTAYSQDMPEKECARKDAEARLWEKSYIIAERGRIQALERIAELTAEVERLKKENEIKLDKWLDHGSDMMEELERLRPENKRLQSKLAKATAALKLAQEHIHEEFCGSKHHEYCIAVGDTLAEIGGKK